MSYVIATPDLVEGAAAELAGIRSTPAEAAAIAAGPTTGVASAAQDEVSVAVAALFSNAGREFQALSAQAHAFHAQFVESIRAGAGAYAAAEAANAAQVLPLSQFAGSASSTFVGAPAALSGAIQAGAQGVLRVIAGFEPQLAALGTGGAPGLIADLNMFGKQVAGPYQALIGNTVSNLQTIGGAALANPFPLLNQFVNNQFGYGQAIAGAFGTGLQNLPTEFANLPVTVQGLLAFNPAPSVQQFVSQQIGYVQTVAASLQNAAHDFGTGVAGLPTALQAGFQSLLAGNTQAAVTDVGRASSTCSSRASTRSREPAASSRSRRGVPWGTCCRSCPSRGRWRRTSPTSSPPDPSPPSSPRTRPTCCKHSPTPASRR